jgi:hypothetical protein
MKMARHSTGPDYTCNFEWAEDVFVQCGGSIKRGFFFEAFPKDTFIRADSKESIQDAERKAWEKHQKHNSCELDHKNPDNFERRDYRNGLGFCVKCGYSTSKIFLPLEICCVCGVNCYHATDKNNDWWCEECWKYVPEHLLTNVQKTYRTILAEEVNFTNEEFEKSLAKVIENLAEKIKDLPNES